MKKIFTFSIAVIVSIMGAFGQTIVTDTIEPEKCMASFYFYPLNQSFENGIGYQFIDQSWSDVVSWVWDFGDGTTSNESQPVHYYGLPGDTVEVCLTILSANGCTDSFCQKFVIREGPYPECENSFQILTMESFPPQYRFIPSKPDSFATYFWDFGDGTWSYELIPTHTYEYSGTYMVCLSYQSPDGCTSFTCDTLKAQGFDQNCKASFEVYQSVYNWRDSTQVDPSYFLNPYFSFIDRSKGDIIQWNWDFGDGTYSNEQNTSHQFQATGIYNVCLQIITSDNCTSTYCEEVYVEIPDYCSFTGTVKDYSGLDGCSLLIVLDNGIILEPAEIVPDFELRDGQRVKLGFTELTDRASICMAGIIARIDCIQEIQDSCLVSFYFYELPWVSSVPPIYKFVMDSGFTITEVVWDFGDGTATNEYSPTHRFQHDGYYTVCVKVVTFEGCIASYCQTSWFDGYDPMPGLCDNFIRLTTDFILNGQTCNGTATASLVDNSGNPAEAIEYMWSTGETTQQINNLCPGYTYSVIVVDATGCAVSGSFSFGTPVVYPDSLIGYWNYEQDNMDFIFNLPVYSDSVYCEWDFGDGQKATGSVVNHTYTTSENYTVQLRVFDYSGNTLYNSEIMVSPGSPTGIITTERESPLVYPIPANEVLYLELKQTGQIDEVQILSSDGRLLDIDLSIDFSGRKAEINTSGLSQGFYIGKIITNSGDIRSFKFLKE